jgi:hypothetical protein
MDTLISVATGTVGMVFISVLAVMLIFLSAALVIVSVIYTVLDLSSREMANIYIPKGDQ